MSEPDRQPFRTGWLIILILLIAGASCASGCIKMARNSLDPADREPGAGFDTASHQDSGNTEPGLPPGDTTAGSSADPGVTEEAPVVAEVAPILPDDPYPVIHGKRFGQEEDTCREPRAFAFEKTFFLRSNASGLRVNVEEPPLIVTFAATPQNDCIENPASCRSTLTSPVHRPHCTITVRDNATREIVLEDGYGYEYSAGTENRTLKIYRSGTYHITVAGEFLDLWMGIATGASPEGSFVLNTPAAAQTTAPVPDNSDGYWY